MNRQDKKWSLGGAGASLFVALALPALCPASEEEFLRWQQVEIVCAERADTGAVVFRAALASNEYTAVSITAFGRKHELSEADRQKLRGFPLDRLQTTHEAGYEELGGHTVHLRLKRESCIPGGYVEATVVISVSRGKGLTISEPPQCEFSKFPQHAWETVLRAMQAGDKAALAKGCTEKGYQSIVKGVRAQEATADELKRLAQAWGKWSLRVQNQTATSAEARFGHEVKEHGVSFLKTTDGWKLDQWLPGE